MILDMMLFALAAFPFMVMTLKNWKFAAIESLLTGALASLLSETTHFVNLSEITHGTALLVLLLVVLGGMGVRRFGQHWHLSVKMLLVLPLGFPVPFLVFGLGYEAFWFLMCGFTGNSQCPAFPIFKW